MKITIIHRLKILVLSLMVVVFASSIMGCENRADSSIDSESGNVTGSAASENDVQSNSSTVTYLDGEEKIRSDRNVPNEIKKYAKKQLNGFLIAQYENPNNDESFPDFKKNTFSTDDFSLGKPFRIIDPNGSTNSYLFPVMWKNQFVDFLTVSGSEGYYSCQYGGNFYPEVFRKIDKKGLLDKAVFVSKNNTWYFKIGDEYYDGIATDENNQ